MSDRKDNLSTPSREVIRGMMRLLIDGVEHSLLGPAAFSITGADFSGQTMRISTTKKETESVSDKTPDHFKGIDVAVRHHGSAITLPAHPAEMDLKTAIRTLERKHSEGEREVSIFQEVPGYVADGLVAFMKAMQRTYGWVDAVPTPGFFSTRPPTMVGIETAPGETTSVVWGRMQLPGVEGWVATDSTTTDGQLRLVIRGEVKQRHLKEIEDLAKLTREIIRTESIYKGRAVEVKVNSDGNIDGMHALKFMDLSSANRDQLVFTDTTQAQIQTSLWTPIQQAALCRQHGIPLKRGVLLSGKYGVGKSLTALVTAQECVDNGWTFLMLSRVGGLDQALAMARQFQPCVIFAEDIDRAISGDERTVEIDDILNTIDGIAAKGTEIMVVLTTNHLEEINPAMLRPGRLDAIIDVELPDASAARRLIRIYGRELLQADDGLEQSGELLAGNIPAVIRECVERAKLVVIGRSHISAGRLAITDGDIATASLGMSAHMKLLEAEQKAPDDGGDIVGAMIGRSVSAALADSGLAASVARLSREVDEVAKRVRERA